MVSASFVSNEFEKSMVRRLVHRIRLRHPWTLEPLAGDGNRMAFTRRFNRPTGLNVDDRLGFEMTNHVGQIVSIELNEQVLPFDSDTSPLRVDINELIQDHNQLRIVLRHDAHSPELGEVSLWIESEG